MTTNTFPKLSTMVFSKNRPMQLMAMLESLFQNSDTDPSNCFILYKADPEYFIAYMEVFSYFPDVNFIPEWNFREQVESFVFNANKHVCFFTDDDVLKRQVRLETCLETLNNNPDSVAFSLRLGRHLNFCYSTQQSQRLPEKFVKTGSDILGWRFKGTDWDWNYPLSVDGHVLRRDDLLEFLKVLPKTWNSPNSFEGMLSHLHPNINKPVMHCFEKSIVFNIPHNKVQTEVDNVYSGGSEKDLLILWESGKKIDISTFQQIDNTAAHQLVPLTYIDR